MLQISVFQRTKANHNTTQIDQDNQFDVANISISKNESKSQPKITAKNQCRRCCKYQYFKERKQITTISYIHVFNSLMLQISVFQRTKANHNDCADISAYHFDVANISISKNESKSQRI